MIRILFLFAMAITTPALADAGESFAKEYANLRILLENVNNRDSAVAYQAKISLELNRLKTIQSSGEQKFHSLSAAQKKLFVKKFQNNRFHCSEVTKVMQERNRLLLNPETQEVLGKTLKLIP